jgi:hypothetical protein
MDKSAFPQKGWTDQDPHSNLMSGKTNAYLRLRRWRNLLESVFQTRTFLQGNEVRFPSYHIVLLLYDLRENLSLSRPGHGSHQDHGYSGEAVISQRCFRDTIILPRQDLAAQGGYTSSALLVNSSR